MLANPDFTGGVVTTTFIDEHPPQERDVGRDAADVELTQCALGSADCGREVASATSQLGQHRVEVRAHLGSAEHHPTVQPDAGAAGATASVDGCADFEGGEPRSRRQLHDPEQWNARLKSELIEAVGVVRSDDRHTVLIAGDYRLSTGLFAGTQLPDVAGFSVVVRNRGAE